MASVIPTVARNLAPVCGGRSQSGIPRYARNDIVQPAELSERVLPLQQAADPLPGLRPIPKPRISDSRNCTEQDPRRKTPCAPQTNSSIVAHIRPASLALTGVTAFCQTPTAHCLPPTADCPLPTAHCRLPTAYCPLPTAYCPSRVRVRSIPGCHRAGGK